MGPFSAVILGQARQSHRARAGGGFGEKGGPWIRICENSRKGPAAATWRRCRRAAQCTGWHSIISHHIISDRTRSLSRGARPRWPGRRRVRGGRRRAARRAAPARIGGRRRRLWPACRGAALSRAEQGCQSIPRHRAAPAWRGKSRQAPACLRRTPRTHAYSSIERVPLGTPSGPPGVQTRPALRQSIRGARGSPQRSKTDRRRPAPGAGRGRHRGRIWGPRCLVLSRARVALAC